MLSFKKFIELNEGADAVAKILGFGLQTLASIAGVKGSGLRSPKKKNVISKETDQIEKTRSTEDKQAKKKFKKFNKEHQKQNYKNWKKSYGPDKIKRPEDYHPEAPDDIDFSKLPHIDTKRGKKKNNKPFKTEKEQEDILNSLFVSTKK